MQYVYTMQSIIKRPSAEILYDEIKVGNTDVYVRIDNFLLYQLEKVEQEDIKLMCSIVDLFQLSRNTLINMSKKPRTGVAHISMVYLKDQTYLPIIHICKSEWLAMTQAEKAFLLGHEASHYVLGHLYKRRVNEGWFNACRTKFGSDNLSAAGIVGLCMSGLCTIQTYKNSSLMKKLKWFLTGSVGFYGYYVISAEFDVLQQQEKEADSYAVQRLQSIEGALDFFDTETDWLEYILTDVAKLRVHPSDEHRAYCLHEWWHERTIAA